MVLDLVVTAVVGFLLGRIAAGFATLAGFVLLALWLLGRAVPPESLGGAVEFVTSAVPAGAELLFVAMVLLGVGTASDGE